MAMTVIDDNFELELEISKARLVRLAEQKFPFETRVVGYQTQPSWLHQQLWVSKK